MATEIKENRKSHWAPSGARMFPNQSSIFPSIPRPQEHQRLLVCPCNVHFKNINLCTMSQLIWLHRRESRGRSCPGECYRGFCSLSKGSGDRPPAKFVLRRNHASERESE